MGLRNFRLIWLGPMFIFTVLYTGIITLWMAYLCFTKGFKILYRQKKREVAPSCLSDPVYGEHGYLHLKGLKIHYVSCGPADKPLMLLLHGFPESWYSWRFQIKEFSKDYRVVAIDMKGYGGSDKPLGLYNYTLHVMANDIKQVIDALGYKSCILVGHDWGGALSWAVSGLYPDLIDKVVILNCPHFDGFRKYLRTHLTQFKKSWYMFFFLIPFLPEIYFGLNDLEFLDTIFLGKQGVHSGATTKEDVEVYKYLYQKFGSRTTPINYIRAGFLYEWPPGMVQKIQKPVLLVWGCRDRALATGNAEQCKKYADDIRIKYIKDSSHWVQMDHPKEVNSYITEFLAEK